MIDDEKKYSTPLTRKIICVVSTSVFSLVGAGLHGAAAWPRFHCWASGERVSLPATKTPNIVACTDVMYVHTCCLNVPTYIVTRQ